MNKIHYLWRSVVCRRVVKMLYLRCFKLLFKKVVLICEHLKCDESVTFLKILT
uniref:Uncharacterized protein n=1 Tax=Octopus bimaculoides TaxID=37653 RepID=A0A0L8GKH7_OCTBM